MAAEQAALTGEGGSLLTLRPWDGSVDAGSDEGHVLAAGRLWGAFASGETCWWLPVTADPSGWLVLILGHDGWQQLRISTTDFLHRWADGLLDLPVLSRGAISREWHITPAGEPVIVPDVPDVARDMLAQLASLIGPSRENPLRFDWPTIEAGLGRPLPPDYKALHESYGRADDDGEPFGSGSLAWNGIHVPSPLSLAKTHAAFAEGDTFAGISNKPGLDQADADDLLLCATTAGRDVLAWDARNPDPARWPVILIEYTDAEVIAGSLTEMLVLSLTRNLYLGYNYCPGNPAPYYGPDGLASGEGFRPAIES